MMRMYWYNTPKFSLQVSKLNVTCNYIGGSYFFTVQALSDLQTLIQGTFED